MDKSVNPDLWGFPQLLCTPQAPLTLWGSSGRESGCRVPASASPVPSSTCPAGDSSSGHPPSAARLLLLPRLPHCSPAPTGTPLLLAAPRLPPAPRSSWLLPWPHRHPAPPGCCPAPTGTPLLLAAALAPPAPHFSQQRPTLPAGPCCVPAPRLPYRHPLAVPGSPCQRPLCAPGPAGAGAAGRALSPAEKLTQLTFPVRRARHPRPESKHGWKAAVRPDTAAPRPAHGPRAGALPGWQRQLSQQSGINPYLEESGDKRQAAGGTLCLLFEQAFPLVYRAAERSKVEGPIARALIYHTWKGSKGIF
nr:translation initiation factor IF-2-like [Taeniopygia guttata]